MSRFDEIAEACSSCWEKVVGKWSQRTDSFRSNIHVARPIRIKTQCGNPNLYVTNANHIKNPFELNNKPIYKDIKYKM